MGKRPSPRTGTREVLRRLVVGLPPPLGQTLVVEHERVPPNRAISIGWRGFEDWPPFRMLGGVGAIAEGVKALHGWSELEILSVRFVAVLLDEAEDDGPAAMVMIDTEDHGTLVVIAVAPPEDGSDVAVLHVARGE